VFSLLQIAERINLKMANENFLTNRVISSINKFELRQFAEKLVSNNTLVNQMHDSFRKTLSIVFSQLPLDQQLIFRRRVPQTSD
jgi:hypothetical protein